MRDYGYDKEPHLSVDRYWNEAWQGYDSAIAAIRNKIIETGRKRTIIAIDCYPGVYDDEILPAFNNGLNPVMTVCMEDLNYSKEKINAMVGRNVTEDRVFGLISCHMIYEFFDMDRLHSIGKCIDGIDEGIVLVYGVGAALFDNYDILIYADMARWEIQLRMRRKEIGNWCADNKDEEFLLKYKRAFFVDWRVIDRHKASLLEKIDYLLDTNKANCPKMITGRALMTGLAQAASQPFRLVPFFDPGPWGGQWMKEVCKLDKDACNYAWCFDCVPEENSLYLKYKDIRVEIPSINLVLCQPVKLLGDRVYARFGTEFPIRFDFLDTMEGGNLSLQVHPLTEYIQQAFGMHYTQDESYYILDAGEYAGVYLGLREGIDKNEMLSELERAQEGIEGFDAGKYVNVWPAQKHDHFLIPAGTIHCSGKNTMVLEISSTPYIFTFKLWDWGRLGLDGKPRSIHINHGKKVIQWDRDTDWVKSNLINRSERVSEGEGWIEEKTGLHEREFIETRRHWFTKPVLHSTGGGVNVLNLIEGDEAIIESPGNSFDPFVVHYAETFVIPASVGDYVIRPYGKSEGKRVGTIKAYVRG